MPRIRPRTEPFDLEILVEEPSMRELLLCCLPGWLGDGVVVRVRTFQGKPDLLKRLPERLAGYAVTRRRNDRLRVVVLLDQDADDCEKLKGTIDTMIRKARLPSRCPGTPPVVLTRIVVRELENWYFGDWPAVRAAFPKVKGDPPGRYRANADASHAKTSAAFRQLLVRAGVAVDSKPEWARRIGPHLAPDGNHSRSFRTFLNGVRELVAADREGP